MGSCCVVLADLVVPMAVLQALGFQPCLNTPTYVTFSVLISRMWKLIRGPCVELPRTDNILNFFKIPRCLCVRYFLPGPFKLCVLALAELLSNATSISACHRVCCSYCWNDLDFMKFLNDIRTRIYIWTYIYLVVLWYVYIFKDKMIILFKK